MTYDRTKHYREVFATELNKLRLNDTVSFAFEGPQVIIPQPGTLALGYSALVTIKHKMLVGQRDVGIHVPIADLTPEDDIIRKAAQFLIEACREERHKMEQPVPPPDLATQAGVPRQEDGTLVPTALLNPRGGGLPFKAITDGYRD